MLRYKTKGLV